MIRLLIGFSGGSDMHYVAAERPTHAVCGARLAYVPQQQPASPFIHAVCQELVSAALADGRHIALPAVAPVDGICSHCGGSVNLDEAGLVVPHNKAIMRGGRLVISTEACAGAGEAPEEEL